MSKAQLYIGLMSGTSADGIDLALVDCSDKTPKLITSYYQAYNQDIHRKITSLYNPADNEIDRAFALNNELAHVFAQAIKTFLQQQKLHSADIVAIGNHGQTIRHRPNQTHPYTLQIGCCQTLACLTQINVIGQFRQKDIALGGQGAPLVPAFHQVIFSNESHDVFIVNIGGIANISYLPSLNAIKQGKTLIGYDSGTGNALMDDWFVVNKANHNSNKHYDNNGNWASTGTANPILLQQLLNDSYFNLPAPKSTGREYFNLTWLHTKLAHPTIKELNLSAVDIQATLLQFTAITISNEIKSISLQAQVYFCGGGIHNIRLKRKLNQLLTDYEILMTDHKKVDADSLEAMAFAWLAYAYNKKIFSNSPTVTGASQKTTLGCAFYP
jgi:anhydro-N-acetylmuramic acid kinase